MKNADGKVALYFLISIVGIALTSCGLTSRNIDSRISSPARVNLLEDAVKSYAQSLKWGYFEEILQHQRTKDGQKIAFSLQSISRHRIISYRNLSKLLEQGGVSARVVAEVEFYEIDTGLLSKKFFVQEWWYDGVRDRWYIASSLPSLETPE